MLFSSKKSKFALIAMIITFLFFYRVDAATCSSSIRNNLSKEAAKVEIVPYLNEDYNPMHVYKYNVYITNLSENIYVIDSNGNRFEYDEFQDEDSVFGMYKPGSKVVFKIYASTNTECSNNQLTSLTVEFDYYNDYSTFEECKGIEEFDLCKRNYNGTIESEEWFKEKVNEYRNNNQELIDDEENEDEKDKTIIDIALEIIKKPIVITILSIILVGLILLIIRKIIQNNKKIKIKYKEIKERGEEYEENK